MLDLDELCSKMMSQLDIEQKVEFEESTHGEVRHDDFETAKSRLVGK